MSTRYALLALPINAFDSGHHQDALSTLAALVASEHATVLPFQMPNFKIGTLDALVQQADDLAKLEASCQAVVAKVADTLRQLLDNDEDRLASYKMVNDSQSPPPTSPLRPPPRR